MKGDDLFRLILKFVLPKKYKQLRERERKEYWFCEHFRDIQGHNMVCLQNNSDCNLTKKQLEEEYNFAKKFLI